MSDPHFLRVEELFWGVRAVPPERRSAWLAETCGTDERLRRDVEAVLAAAEGPGALATPSAEEIAGWLGPAESGDLTGARVGNCRLVRLLGQGGMGRVYEAVQEPPGRRVAVKLLRQAFPDEGARARFEHEARLLAAVDHPGVCGLLEAGLWASPSGERLPYTVLELVEGARPITEAAREHGLSRRQRIALLSEVCRGVHACHARGVLHRDLKPANLLVDGAGRPHVIDFGIARALEDGVGGDIPRTRSGVLLGTPSHMSPEQLLGRPEDVDARSDVYALGVVLYELLTGRLPRDFGGGTLLEVLSAVRERPPTPPERLDPSLRGDLSAILLKALDPDPSRRYATAAELGQDLDRFLAHEPVVARPAGPGRTLALWARRHRALAGVCAALLLAVASGTTVAVLTAAKEREARQKAVEARERADAFLRRSREFVPWLLSDLQRQVAGLPGGARAAADLANGVREHLASLSYDEVRDADLLLTASWSYHLLAETVGGMGPDLLRQPDQARRDLEAARDLAARAHVLQPSAAAQDLVARAILGLLWLDLGTGQLDVAETRLAEAREVVAAMPPGPVATPYRLALGIRVALAVLEGEYLNMRQRHAEAYEVLRAAWAALIAGAEGGDASAADGLTLSFRLARTAIWTGREAEAGPAVEAMDAACRAIGGAEPLQGALAAYRAHVQLLDAVLSRGGDPEPWFQRCLAALQRWRERAPGDRRPDREEASLRMRWGTAHVNAGRPGPGRPHLEAAQSLSRRLLAEDPEDAEVTYSLLQSEVALAEAAALAGEDDAADQGMAAGTEVLQTLTTRFPETPSAAEGRTRVPLTQAAIDTIRARRAASPEDARRLLARALERTREGEALYAEAFRRHPGITSFRDTAAACRAEAERLQGELAAVPRD